MPFLSWPCHRPHRARSTASETCFAGAGPLIYLKCDTQLLCRPQLFQSRDAPNKTTTPEEFIRMTKGITMATAKAVAAGNSARQEDIIHTANLSRKAISDMLTTCKVLF